MSVPCSLRPYAGSVKKQVEVRQALREWFEALRGDSEGVHGAQLVDAVITLGLNHDYKQVRSMRICISSKHGIPAENSQTKWLQHIMF